MQKLEGEKKPWFKANNPVRIAAVPQEAAHSAGCACGTSIHLDTDKQPTLSHHVFRLKAPANIHKARRAKVAVTGSNSTAPRPASNATAIALAPGQQFGRNKTNGTIVGKAGIDQLVICVTQICDCTTSKLNTRCCRSSDGRKFTLCSRRIGVGHKQRGRRRASRVKHCLWKT